MNNKSRSTTQKVLVICGPTATGKTALGVRLAKTFNGEIISADSRQVYKGMNIATGKDIEEAEMVDGTWHIKGIPIHLLDIKEPTEEFSISEYEELAEARVKKILAVDKLPILLGGTGFYIKAITNEIETINIPPNPELRKKYERKTADELYVLFHKLDPAFAEALNFSERKNKQRLIRRLEIAQSGKSLSEIKPNTNYDFLIICLNCDPVVLKGKIFERINKMFANGAKHEVEKLLKMGLSWKSQSMTAIGYKLWQPFFEGKKTEEEVLLDWKNREWAYATNQITWFKKINAVHWFDITKEDFERDVEDLVASWYNPS